MADLPYLALWPKDYLAATFGLNAEQHGGYLLLLMHAWLRPACSIPNDDEWLASNSGMTAAQWRKNRDAILQFWKLDKRRNEWTQKRLKEERRKATQKSRSAKDSASSRWEQRKKSDAFAMRSQCSPEPYPDKKPNGFSKRARAQKKPTRIDRILEGFTSE